MQISFPFFALGRFSAAENSLITVELFYSDKIKENVIFHYITPVRLLPLITYSLKLKSFPHFFSPQKDPSNEHVKVYSETNTRGHFQSIMDIINVSKSCFILPFTILGGGKHKAGLNQMRVGTEEADLE